MSAELWGAGVKLEWVMNRAIFQGITAAEAGRANGKKAPKRHMGKGPGVAPVLSPERRVCLLSWLCPKRKALCCLPARLLSCACC